MIAIIITAIIGVTAVTIYAMHCNSARMSERENAIITEITRHIMEKAVKEKTVEEKEDVQ